MPSSDTLIVTLDVGTSSVRALVYNQAGTALEGFGEHVPYSFTATSDGGVEIDPEKLFTLCVQCLSRVHAQLSVAGRRPAAVGCSAFWHSFFGVDSEGKPSTPFIHLFDTRSEPQAERLASMLDARAVHQRTGCRFHASYWPAKLLWLHENAAEGCARTKLWLSFGEFLYLRLFGQPGLSTSMVSATGIWNLRENRYDSEVVAALPIRSGQLVPEDAIDKPAGSLLAHWKAEWPLFDGIRWFPALGDGACNSVGSGCICPDTFALMVGTSGAMRAVAEAADVAIPDGLWCYRVDRGRYILGGALSNGGEVYAWMKRHLALGDEAESEAELMHREPGRHGLTVLPFFAGERSPWWRADLRATVTGLNLATTSLDILQASLESVALNFRRILDLLRESVGTPRRIIASGGALAHSRAWTQMMADALGSPVLSSCEAEASSRGAALMALESLGLLRIEQAPVRTGAVFQPVPERHSAYAAMLEEQSRLMAQLYPPVN